MWRWGIIFFFKIFGFVETWYKFFLKNFGMCGDGIYSPNTPLRPYGRGIEPLARNTIWKVRLIKTLCHGLMPKAYKARLSWNSKNPDQLNKVTTKKPSNTNSAQRTFYSIRDQIEKAVYANMFPDGVNFDNAISRLRE